MNFDKLRNFLGYYLPMLGVPGSDTVIYKDHEEIFRHTCGFDSLTNRTPLKKDAIYNIYSCTKIATCVAAMQLVERGEIMPSDPVHIYLPEYKNVLVRKSYSDGSTALVHPESPILIKHLFNMTSGLDYDLNRPAVARLIAESRGECNTLDVVKALAKDPIAFEPGEHFCYGLSHDVLGGIVELVSGMKLGDYMKKNIFDPLGMKDTTFNIDNLNYSRIASQYNYDNIGRCAVEIPRDSNEYRFGRNYQSGGAGLLSTVDDYILLADALANDGVGKSGKRILSSAAVRLLSTPTLSPTATKDYSCMGHHGFDYCYGVRRMVDIEAGDSLAPEGLFGWDGKRMCMCFSDPKNKIAFFHAEHIDGFHSILLARIINVIYSCLDDN